jgi:hypothetical protein
MGRCGVVVHTRQELSNLRSIIVNLGTFLVNGDYDLPTSLFNNAMLLLLLLLLLMMMIMKGLL